MYILQLFFFSVFLYSVQNCGLYLVLLQSLLLHKFQHKCDKLLKSSRLLYFNFGYVFLGSFVYSYGLVFPVRGFVSDAWVPLTPVVPLCSRHDACAAVRLCG